MAHEASLTRAELTEVVTSPYFYSRIGVLAIRTLIEGKETAFAVGKFGGTVHYSQLVIPEGAEDNSGLDPRKSLHMDNFLERFYTGRWADSLALLIHSHPRRPTNWHDIVRCPSSDDLKFFLDANNGCPGHVGGVMTTNLGGIPHSGVLLYRASPDLDAERLLGAEVMHAQTAPQRIAAMEAAGMLFAHIVIHAHHDTTYGLNNLVNLYPEEEL